MSALKIHCPRCDSEQAAYKREATRGSGKRLRALGRWENVCLRCGFGYAAPPPGVRLRGQRRTLERAGQQTLFA